MNEDAIPELQRFALLDRPAPVLLRVVIKLSPTERICAEQYIAARVPAGRMPKTPGAVEDGDAQFFSFDRAIHVHPVRPFPPTLLLPLRACRVHHAPGRGVQLLGQADTEGPFLRVT